MDTIEIELDEKHCALIGTDVRVFLFPRSASEVRLGIEAPKSVPVVRSELLARGARASGVSDG